MSQQERCPNCDSKYRNTRKKVSSVPGHYWCTDPWYDSAPGSVVAEQPQHDPNLAYCPCPSCLEQPPVKQAVQLCKFCDRTETNWRYNRCPNCGELTDKCEMCGQTIGREQAVEGLVEALRRLIDCPAMIYTSFSGNPDIEQRVHKQCICCTMEQGTPHIAGCHIDDAQKALAQYEASRGGKQ